MKRTEPFFRCAAPLAPYNLFLFVREKESLTRLKCCLNSAFDYRPYESNA